MIRRLLRRLFPPKDACPYVKCRAPMRFVERVSDHGVLVDVYRCTGKDEHEWSRLSEEEGW